MAPFLYRARVWVSVLASVPGLCLAQVFILSCSELVSQGLTILQPSEWVMEGSKLKEAPWRPWVAALSTGPVVHLSPAYRLNKPPSHMSPRTQACNVYTGLFIVHKGRSSGKEMGDWKGTSFFHLISGNFGVPGMANTIPLYGP